MSLIKRSSVASVTTGTVVVGAFIYAALTENTDLITFLAGAAIGYLLKEVKNGNGSNTSSSNK